MQNFGTAKPQVEQAAEQRTVAHAFGVLPLGQGVEHVPEASSARPAGVPIWIGLHTLNFNRPRNYAQRPAQLYQAAESRQPAVDRVGRQLAVHEVRLVVEGQGVRLPRTTGQEQAGGLLKARGLDERLEVFEVLAVGGDGLGLAAVQKSPQQAGRRGSGIETTGSAQGNREMIGHGHTSKETALRPEAQAGSQARRATELTTRRR